MQQYILLYSALFIVSTDSSDIFPFSLFCIDLLDEKHTSPSLPPKTTKKQNKKTTTTNNLRNKNKEASWFFGMLSVCLGYAVSFSWVEIVQKLFW